MVVITAKYGDGENSETCKYDFGEDLSAAIELFGEEIIFVNFRAQCIIGIQSHMRNEMRSVDSEGKATPVLGKGLQKSVTAWKPGAKKPAKSATERAKETMGKLSPEQRAALFADFQNEK